MTGPLLSSPINPVWSVITGTPFITTTVSPGGTWGPFNAINADATGINDAIGQSLALTDPNGKQASVPVFMGRGVFVASATEHLEEQVPVIGFSAYFRDDSNHTSGTDIFPTGAASNFNSTYTGLRTTTLSGNGGSIAAGATSAKIATALVMPGTSAAAQTKGFFVKIDSEWILVSDTGATPFTTWTIARAQFGTTAASHNDGATVTYFEEYADNPTLWDTSVPASAPNTLETSLYLAGVVCEANGVAIDGIHIDNPDHATFDHVNMRGFVNGFIAETLNINNSAKAAGEIELFHCYAINLTGTAPANWGVAASFGSLPGSFSQLNGGFGFSFNGGWSDGFGGSNVCITFTNIYMINCHCTNASTDAFQFVNCANALAIGVWADGHTVAGIRGHAQNASTGTTFAPGSISIQGVHLKSSANPPIDLLESKDVGGETGHAHMAQFSISSGTAPVITGMHVNGGEASSYACTNNDGTVPTIRLKIDNVDGINGNGSGYVTTTGFSGPDTATTFTLSMPASQAGTGVGMGNCFPFKIQVWLTAFTTVTAIKVRSGGTSNIADAGATTGAAFILDPGERFGWTGTGTPTVLAHAK